MDGFCDQVLASAALALYQNRRRFAGGNLADEIHELGHLRGDAHDAVIAGVAPYLAAQALDFGAQARGLEGIFDGDVKLIEVDRFADEVVGSELERGFDIVELGVGGDHDDGAGVATFLELIKNFDTGEVGHAHVEED